MSTVETETESQVKVGTLTKADIAAFKIADTISLWWEGGESRDLTEGTIKLGKRRSGDGWQNAESEYEIKANGHLYRYSSGNGRQTCRYWNSSLKYCPETQTVFQLMRVGDIIQMKWVMDNNNDNYKKLDWHCDELSIVLIRGKARYEFLIEKYVGPNNCGRMCR